MTLDEDLVAQVDRAVRRLGTTRSAFTREALRRALAQLTITAQEQRHRAGYRTRPAAKNEFAGWERDQAWGDD